MLRPYAAPDYSPVLKNIPMRFIIEDTFWSLFPDTRIGIVIARGLNNASEHAPKTGELLSEAVKQAAANLPAGELTEHPAIAPWREAYRTFGMKPSKYRSSIENLIRSVHSRGVPSINPLVDFYNTVSLAHLLPCGGEDLSTIQGDIRLTRATGDEHFVPLGSTEPSPPQPGEVIYRDDAGVICRGWNWREAERTKLTPQTTDAFLCAEWLPGLRETALTAACEDLARLGREYLGAETAIHYLDAANREVTIIP
jgi:DNA/RNA-binding domain of Phe-tRNA-synthetase-like protein